jgi:hypothetical protein
MPGAGHAWKVRHDQPPLARHDRLNVRYGDPPDVTAKPAGDHDKDSRIVGVCRQFDIVDNTDVLARLRIDEEATAVSEPVLRVEIHSSKVDLDVDKPPALALVPRAVTRFGDKAQGL